MVGKSMDEKEFKDHLQSYRKTRNKKIISNLFLVVVPALLGTLFVVITAFQILANVVDGVAVYDIVGTAPHYKSSSFNWPVSYDIFPPMFISQDAEISWDAHYPSDINSPAPLKFIVVGHGGSGGEKIYVNITTSSYEGRLSGVDAGTLSFNWINEDNTQDVAFGGRIIYSYNLLWIGFFMFTGIFLITLSCVEYQTIYNRSRQKNVPKQENK